MDSVTGSSRDHNNAGLCRAAGYQLILHNVSDKGTTTTLKDGNEDLSDFIVYRSREHIYLGLLYEIVKKLLQQNQEVARMTVMPWFKASNSTPLHS